MALRQDASTGQVVDDHKPDQPSADGQPVMALKIYSPFKIYFDDDAFSVSALNDTGPFDILPHHHNFITLVTACSMQIKGPRGDQAIEISGGLMHVKADKVVVFLNV